MVKIFVTIGAGGDNGKIDDVKIYDTMLLTSEIAKLSGQ